jgi:hypothetical protein
VKNVVKILEVTYEKYWLGFFRKHSIVGCHMFSCLGNRLKLVGVDVGFP